MNQAVLILIKPDGLKKSLTGNILTRLSETKLEIVAAKMVRVSKQLAEEHYKQLKDKPFFEEIIRMGTVDDVLAELGWQKKDGRYIPPVVVSNQTETFSFQLPA